MIITSGFHFKGIIFFQIMQCRDVKIETGGNSYYNIENRTRKEKRWTGNEKTV